MEFICAWGHGKGGNIGVKMGRREFVEC